MTRRRSASSRLADQTMGLAMAVPQVVSHRLTRMALAGPQPNSRDRAEFHRMGAEKVVAFSQGWMAMNTQLWQAQQKMMLQWMQMCWQPGLWTPTQMKRSATQAGNLGMGALAAGVAPIHKRAVSNARRLATTPLVVPASSSSRKKTSTSVSPLAKAPRKRSSTR